MPHIIVKLWPGKSEAQKKELAERITKDVMSVLKYGEESVSVAMEEVSSREWMKQVYKPDIQEKFKNSGIEPYWGDTAEFKKFVASELVKWTSVIKSAGIEPE